MAPQTSQPTVGSNTAYATYQELGRQMGAALGAGLQHATEAIRAMVEAFDRWFNGPTLDDLYRSALAGIEMDAATVLHRFDIRTGRIVCTGCDPATTPFGLSCPSITGDGDWDTLERL